MAGRRTPPGMVAHTAAAAAATAHRRGRRRAPPPPSAEQIQVEVARYCALPVHGPLDRGHTRDTSADARTRGREARRGRAAFTGARAGAFAEGHHEDGCVVELSEACSGGVVTPPPPGGGVTPPGLFCHCFFAPSVARELGVDVAAPGNKRPMLHGVVGGGVGTGGGGVGATCCGGGVAGVSHGAEGGGGGGVGGVGVSWCWSGRGRLGVGGVMVSEVGWRRGVVKVVVLWCHSGGGGAMMDGGAEGGWRWGSWWARLRRVVGKYGAQV